jgi:hypothetical protein
VGTPESPVNVDAWDLDVANEVVTDLDLGENELRSGSVNTVDLSIKQASVGAALSGYVVPVGRGVGVSDAVDPSNTTTPVSDAAQILRDSPGPGWSGYIILPPDGVDNDAKVTCDGFGGFVCPGPRATEIRFANDTIGIDWTGAGKTFIQGGLRLVGPGWDSGTQPAMYCGDASVGWHIWDWVETEDWGGQSLLVDPGPMYFVNVGIWSTINHDPAQSGSVRDYIIDHDSGASNTVDHIIMFNDAIPPSGTVPGGFYSESSVYETKVVESIGAVGDTGPENVIIRSNGYFGTGHVNIEDASVSGLGKLGHAFRTYQGRIHCRGDVNVVDRNIDWGIYADQARGGQFPAVFNGAGSTLNQEFVRLTSPPIDLPAEIRAEQSQVGDYTGTTGWAYGVECVDGYLKP